MPPLTSTICFRSQGSSNSLLTSPQQISTQSTTRYTPSGPHPHPFRSSLSSPQSSLPPPSPPELRALRLRRVLLQHVGGLPRRRHQHLLRPLNRGPHHPPSNVVRHLVRPQSRRRSLRLRHPLGSVSVAYATERALSRHSSSGVGH